MTETIFLLLWIIMAFLQSIVIANTGLLLDNKECVADSHGHLGFYRNQLCLPGSD